MRESLGIARLFMVLASVSPLFILWAIRGNSLIPEPYFGGFCVLMIIGPNLFLWLRVTTAKKLKEKRTLTVGKADDHRDHILVYLFAMLLPFYSIETNSWRMFSATLIAIGFVVFLFWHLNLHYMNVLFAFFGYRVFTIHPPADNNPISSKTPYILITRRVIISSGEQITAYRISDTVYWEVK